MGHTTLTGFAVQTKFNVRNYLYRCWRTEVGKRGRWSSAEVDTWGSHPHPAVGGQREQVESSQLGGGPCRTGTQTSGGGGTAWKVLVPYGGDRAYF